MGMDRHNYGQCKATTNGKEMITIVIRLLTPGPNRIQLHCRKYPYIHGYFVASFRILTEPVPYTFLSVSRRTNVAKAMRTRASLFRLFENRNVYETGFVKIRKTRRKVSADMRIFLRCSAVN